MAKIATALTPVKLFGALVIGAGAFVAYLYAGGASADSTRAKCVQCQASDSADATKWIKNGTYRLDAVTLTDDEKELEVDPDSLRKMTRIKPPLLSASENDALVEKAIRAIDNFGEKGDSTVLENQWPQLTRRARYAYSLFLTDDQPMDCYNVYVRVGRNKYLVVVGRDLESGEFTERAGEGMLINRYGTEGKPEHLKAFEEIDAATGR
ncbi:hypothetical protein BFW87_27910 [Pseudomonas fluorescens]|uniref:Uncharacterized protein n=1 Tax=Pseudomonas fluorescens TaxID=294 RepID=A0A1T2XZL9_PSEFL|nr:hypothetical protein [Pseudomonas fluorescens]OPA85260.1 hypothetical protein BFW87_27910 [Pseudomonas fluorescens]